MKRSCKLAERFIATYEAKELLATGGLVADGGSLDAKKYIYREFSQGSVARSSLHLRPGQNYFLHVLSQANITIEETDLWKNGEENVIVLLAEDGARAVYYSRSLKSRPSRKKFLVVVGRGATVEKYDACLGGSDLRRQTTILLTGEGAATKVSQAIFANGDALQNFSLTIEHRAANTNSAYASRVIAAGKARVICRAQTNILAPAKKSGATQKMDHLLLSRGASVNGLPRLEIKNNDVVCTHAMTAGHQGDEELFYAQSRGLTVRQSKALLAGGFMRPVINVFPKNLRANLNRIVERKITEAVL